MAIDYRSNPQRVRDELRADGYNSDECDLLVPLIVAAGGFRGDEFCQSCGGWMAVQIATCVISKLGIYDKCPDCTNGLAR